jgi:hypothetical protein
VGAPHLVSIGWSDNRTVNRSTCILSLNGDRWSGELPGFCHTTAPELQIVTRSEAASFTSTRAHTRPSDSGRVTDFAAPPAVGAPNIRTERPPCATWMAAQKARISVALSDVRQPRLVRRRTGVRDAERTPGSRPMNAVGRVHRYPRLLPLSRSQHVTN